MDEENSKKVVKLLHSLKNTFGVTILFTTHNEQITHTANRIITIFNVCIILGQTSNISSAKIFNAQTMGHNYEYQIQYQGYKTTGIFSNAMMYIDSTSSITINNLKSERTVTGLYDINALYELKNKNNELLTTPAAV